MNKIITPAALILALGAGSIAAAPVPALASSAHETTYSISTDVGLSISEAKGAARLNAPSGNISASWRRQAGGYSLSVSRTQPSTITYVGHVSTAGQISVVKVLRATQRRLAGKPHYVNVDSIARDIRQAAQQGA